MFNFKDFFISLSQIQTAAALSSIDAVSKFTGTETNTYVKNMKTFVETSQQNAEKAIKGEFFFSGLKK